jgi:hypothetical protein
MSIKIELTKEAGMKLDRRFLSGFTAAAGITCLERSAGEPFRIEVSPGLWLAIGLIMLIGSLLLYLTPRKEPKS